MDSEFYFVYYSASIDWIQFWLSASLGIRQSPRGLRETLPTFGPSGRHERLNCWLKKRLRNVFSHFLIVASSYLFANAFCAKTNNFSGV